ncbi:hypothetical protein CFP56_035946 [Quercus suber]|uniref:Uncharacterized protein n=1 Tax=Quercus suber TaxID=58331 RepID=A0AAW0J9S0_QUESU
MSQAWLYLVTTTTARFQSQTLKLNKFLELFAITVNKKKINSQLKTIHLTWEFQWKITSTIKELLHNVGITVLAFPLFVIENFS